MQHSNKPFVLNRWMAQVAFSWLVLISFHLYTFAEVANNQIITKLVIPDLPANHYRFWLRNHPLAFKEFKTICHSISNVALLSNVQEFAALHRNVSLENSKYLIDLNYGKKVLDEICSSIHLVSDSCWGYESGCQHIYVMPHCDEPQENSGTSVDELRSTWFNQADFGYIIQLRHSLTKFCSYDKHYDSPVKSSLDCLAGFKMCRGKSIMFDFKDLGGYNSPLTNYGKQDLIKQNQVGGWNCDLQEKRIKAEVSHKGALQSWFNELEHYQKIQKQPESVCLETIKEHVFIIKLDAVTNMYHYFCNFINLYATFHLNNRFSHNNRIIIWDKQLPRSKFELMWKAFSEHEIRHIGEFEGKRVCFENYILTLLPRTIGGLYYNTNLVQGCSKSGLFDAFNKHVLHRLNIQQNYTLDEHIDTNNERLRITFVTRSSSPHRKILNENHLLKAMGNKYSSKHIIKLIDYAELDFYQQLELSSNTDLLVGLHGAGLTHTLFLPDWAGLFEIYDCEDTCYRDLARLRGASYFKLDPTGGSITKVRVVEPNEVTRLNASKLLDNEKFSNYRIHQPVFLETLDKAIDKVKENRLNHFSKIKKQPKLQKMENIRAEHLESQKVEKIRSTGDRSEL